MKFSAEVGNGQENNWLNFDGDADHRLDIGIVFWIGHYWKIRKVVNGYSFILIRQMAALIRRALAEVCIVPVFLLVCDTLTDAGERAAVVAGTVVRRTVDGCRPADAAAARDAKSTTAADDRRHRTVVLRQTHS